MTADNDIMRDQINTKSLPDYEKPPVIEVVCGVYLKPIKSLLAPHLGLLWEKFKPDYVNCQEVAPLSTTKETFDGPPEIEIDLTDKPPLPRIWFIHADDTRIIQVQRDAFLHNWRKTKPEDEYPRYHNVIRMFEDHISIFSGFLKDQNLGDINPLQYELTYVNNIPQNEGWSSTSDIRKLFPDFSWRTDPLRFLPTYESINWRTAFLLPNQSGRLHITIRNGMRRTDNHPILNLELKVRGFSKNDKESMRVWFDVAREWIVRGFADITGDEIQAEVWRKK